MEVIAKRFLTSCTIHFKVSIRIFCTLFMHGLRFKLVCGFKTSSLNVGQPVFRSWRWNWDRPLGNKPTRLSVLKYTLFPFWRSLFILLLFVPFGRDDDLYVSPLDSWQLNYTCSVGSHTTWNTCDRDGIVAPWIVNPVQPYHFSYCVTWPASVWAWFWENFQRSRKW